jgi:diacylglycerol kinase family enzyme
VVGGGDGSVSTLAGLLVGGTMPLGILPLGTLNHFAKDLGLPLDIEAAIAVIAAGQVRAVDVAEVNGRYFINNSSIGLYAHMLSDRIRQQRHFGRGKWAALTLAMLRMLYRFPLYRLTLSTADGTRQRKTPFAFIGNNKYGLDPLTIGAREALDRGQLCVYVANSQSRLDFIALSLNIALGRPDRARGFELLKLEEVEIHSRRHRLRVARDGELEIMRPPLRYRIHPQALRVIAPRVAI